ncbi:MAG: ABC transporter permease, partial [Bdellovibrionota bacterium]
KPGETRVSWVFEVLSLELRKAFSYRADFWISFLGSVFTELGVAYFLWRAIYLARGVSVIGGYSFAAMMFYYLATALVSRIVRGTEFGYVADEIYSGTLTRYLVYPVSFFNYKFMGYVAQGIVGMLQLALSCAVFFAAAGIPAGTNFTPWGVVLSMLACLGASYLYFSMTCCLELVAFWAEGVWSLGVMLRFISSLLGGALLPLSIFPEAISSHLSWLPFPYMISFPVRCLMQGVSPLEWGSGILMIAGWSLVFTLLSRLIWQKGSYEYSGVGI